MLIREERTAQSGLRCDENRVLSLFKVYKTKNFENSDKTKRKFLQLYEELENPKIIVFFYKSVSLRNQISTKQAFNLKADKTDKIDTHPTESMYRASY